MIKNKHGWGGRYNWGKDNRWSNDAWNWNALQGCIWTPAEYGFSLADGAAFAKIGGVDLGAFAGVEGTSTPWKLSVIDSTRVVASGFVGAVDGAEALGGELVTNGTFAANITGWTNVATKEYGTFEWSGGKLHAVTDGAILSAGVSGDNIAFVVGKLYKIGFTVAVASGVGPEVLIKANSLLTARFSCRIGGVVANHGTGSYVYYFTATVTESAVFYFYNSATESGDFTLDDISVKEVTHVGVTGVHIVSAKGGSTRNWASVGSGFDYNVPSYRAEVRRA